MGTPFSHFGGTDMADTETHTETTSHLELPTTEAPDAPDSPTQKETTSNSSEAPSTSGKDEPKSKWNKVREAVGDLKSVHNAAALLVQNAHVAQKLARSTSQTADEACAKVSALSETMSKKNDETNELLSKISASLQGTPATSPWGT